MKHIRYAGESHHRSEEMREKHQHSKGMARGGRVATYPHMDAGAVSGEGRLEKIKAYGANAHSKGGK